MLKDDPKTIFNKITDSVKSTYSDLLQNYLDVKFLEARTILASIIETIDQINEYVLSLISGISMFLQI